MSLGTILFAALNNTNYFATVPYYIRVSRNTGYDNHRFRRSGSGYNQGRYISFTWNQY